MTEKSLKGEKKRENSRGIAGIRELCCFIHNFELGKKNGPSFEKRGDRNGLTEEKEERREKNEERRKKEEKREEKTYRNI